MQSIKNFFKKLGNPSYCYFTEQEVEAIILACKEGDLDTLKKWYDDGRDFSNIYQKQTGLSLLMIGCKTNNTAIVQWLLTGDSGKPLNGIDVKYQIMVEKKQSKEFEKKAKNIAKSEKDPFKNTATENLLWGIDMAIEHDAIANKSNVYHVAAQYSNPEILELLLNLQEKQNCLTISNRNWDIPLFVALEKGSGEAIYRLHQAQVADLNSKDYENLKSSLQLRDMVINKSKEHDEEQKILVAYFTAYQNNQKPSDEVICKLRAIETKVPRLLDFFGGMTQELRDAIIEKYALDQVISESKYEVEINETLSLSKSTNVMILSNSLNEKHNPFTEYNDGSTNITTTVSRNLP